MPTLEMRDQTNMLCLAGYLSLSTGTFSNDSSGERQRQQQYSGVCYQDGREKKTTSSAAGRVEYGWESLVCDWF